MKKLFATIGMFVLAYAVYIDLTIGTLQEKGEKTEESQVLSTETIQYMRVEVKPGDTVLSIVERLMNEPLSIPFEKVVKDFETINAGMKPEEIQPGRVYNFPIYAHFNE